MQSQNKKDVIFVRLFENEDVIEELKKVCKEHKIKTGIVISAIGQLKKTKLGYYKEKGNYAEESFEKPLEILSLTGNIINQKNEYLSHLHIVLGDEKKNAIGGHFIEGKVGVLAEIVILKTSISAYRKLNEKTGLKSLHLE
jgi:predicted DNA-binding protein with PD1-like motif